MITRRYSYGHAAQETQGAVKGIPQYFQMDRCARVPGHGVIVLVGAPRHDISADKNNNVPADATGLEF